MTSVSVKTCDRLAAVLQTRHLDLEYAVIDEARFTPGIALPVQRFPFTDCCNLRNSLHRFREVVAKVNH